MHLLEELKHELLLTKLEVLYHTVYIRLYPLQNNFKNQLNYLFSMIQKQYNKEGILKSDLKDTYISKLVSFYTSLLGDLSDITLKRVKGEVDNFSLESDKINYICKCYIDMRISTLADSIISDVFNCIQMCEDGLSSKDLYKEAVNTVFNKSFKGGRSSIVALTEVYKFHNFMYLNLMPKFNYKYCCIVSAKSINYTNVELTTIMSDFNTIPPLFSGDKSVLFLNNNSNFLAI